MCSWRSCNDPVNFCSGVILDKETQMSKKMEKEIKRWTAKRTTALVLEIIQGKTTVSVARGSFDIAPSEVEVCVDKAKRAMKNARRTKPWEVKKQYERHFKELQEAYGEVMPELPVRKELIAMLEIGDEK